MNYICCLYLLIELKECIYMHFKNVNVYNIIVTIICHYYSLLLRLQLSIIFNFCCNDNLL